MASGAVRSHGGLARESPRVCQETADGNRLAARALPRAPIRRGRYPPRMLSSRGPVAGAQAASRALLLYGAGPGDEPRSPSSFSLRFAGPTPAAERRTRRHNAGAAQTIPSNAAVGRICHPSHGGKSPVSTDKWTDHKKNPRRPRMMLAEIRPQSAISGPKSPPCPWKVSPIPEMRPSPTPCPSSGRIDRTHSHSHSHSSMFKRPWMQPSAAFASSQGLSP